MSVAAFFESAALPPFTRGHVQRDWTEAETTIDDTTVPIAPVAHVASSRLLVEGYRTFTAVLLRVGGIANAVTVGMLILDLDDVTPFNPTPVTIATVTPGVTSPSFVQFGAHAGVFGGRVLRTIQLTVQHAGGTSPMIVDLKFWART